MWGFDHGLEMLYYTGLNLHAKLVYNGIRIGFEELRLLQNIEYYLDIKHASLGKSCILV